MSQSARFGFDLLDVNQSQKEVTTNEFAQLFDIVCSTNIKGQIPQNTVPSTISEGDTYILGSEPSGDWQGQANNVAYYTSSGWRFFTPPLGLLAYIEDWDLHAKWNGTSFDQLAGFKMPNARTADVSLSKKNNGEFIEVNTASNDVRVFLPLPSDVARGYAVSIFKQAATNSVTVIPPLKNKLDDSEQISNWSLSRLTVTDDQDNFPGKTTDTADQVMETSDSGIHEFSKNFTVAATDTDLVVGIKIKAVGASQQFVLMCDDGSSSNRAKARFRVTDTSVTFSSGTGTFAHESSEVTALDSGWYQLRMRLSKSNETNLTFRVRLYDGSESYTGNTSNGWYVGQAQVHTFNTDVLPPYVESSVLSVDGTINGSSLPITLVNQYDKMMLVSQGSADWYKM